MPVAPPGFVVTAYDRGSRGPRQLYLAPNKDLFVAESAKARVMLLRDNDGDGYPDQREIFASGLPGCFGMLVLHDDFYIAATTGVWKFPYQAGQTRLGPGTRIAELPDGGHNTRNLAASPDGSKLYVAVGSSGNIAEQGMQQEFHRADILEMNPDGSGLRVYASGLRNPVGLAWHNNALWTTVNERDMLGADLPPDYFTRVREGAFYGWPYSYWGGHEDPRRAGERPDLVRAAIVPDVALGAHVAPLGFAFYNSKKFPQQYRGGAFIAEHGSWNRPEFAGYKVVYLPFAGGKPVGPPQDFLTGFIADGAKSLVHGRPVGIAVAPDGALLVSDDGGNMIWRVAPR